MDWGQVANYSGQAANLISNIIYSGKNYRLQKKAYEDYRSDIETTRNREDTAIQRRRADLEAAGFNPLLAVGQPAEASSSAQGQAPQDNRGEAILQSLQLADTLKTHQVQRDLMAAEIERTRTQTKVANESHTENIKILKAQAEFESDMRGAQLRDLLAQTNLKVQQLTNDQLTEQMYRQQQEINKQVIELNRLGIESRSIENSLNEIKLKVENATHEMNIEQHAVDLAVSQKQLEYLELQHRVEQYSANISVMAGMRPGDNIGGGIAGYFRGLRVSSAIRRYERQNR